MDGYSHLRRMQVETSKDPLMNSAAKPDKETNETSLSNNSGLVTATGGVLTDGPNAT